MQAGVNESKNVTHNRRILFDLRTRDLPAFRRQVVSLGSYPNNKRYSPHDAPKPLAKSAGEQLSHAAVIQSGERKGGTRDERTCTRVFDNNEPLICRIRIVRQSTCTTGSCGDTRRLK